MSKKHPCPKCGFESSSATECVRCGINFKSFNNLGISGVESEALVQQSIIPVEAEDPQTPSVFLNFKVNVWSLPLGISVSALFLQFWVFRYLIFLFCVIPVHEMGHAFAAWMSGRFALPIGAIVPTAGLTIIGFKFNIFISLIYFAVFSVLAFKAYQKKLYFWTVVSGLFLFMSVAVLTKHKAEEIGPLISFAGIAGEFLLSALLIISFYQPTFKILRWDFFRYLFFSVGCMAFTNACLMWIRIQNKLASLPFGSAISADGAGDSNGDMNRLIQAGWSEYLIVSKYLILAKIAVTLILIQYIYSLIKSKQNKN